MSGAFYRVLESFQPEKQLLMPSIRSYLIKNYMQRALRKAESLPLAERRARMDENAQRFKNAKGVTCQNVDSGGRPAEWLIPERATPNAAVLYLHGGAYTAGSPASHRALASHIAHAGQVRVLLLDYRLAPENPFPAALEDALHAFTWIQKTLSIPPERIIVMGDSAGGGLAIATALRLRDGGYGLPAALICLSPWLDLSLSGDSVRTQLGIDPFFSNTQRLHESAFAYAGKDRLTEPEVSPLFATLEGLPRIHIQVGEDEILLSDSLELAEAARRAGIEVQIEVWPGMWHVWQAFCDLMPESRRAITNMGKIINECLSVPTSNREAG